MGNRAELEYILPTSYLSVDPTTVLRYNDPTEQCQLFILKVQM